MTVQPTASAPASAPAPRRILLIKPSALGDVVTALPVLRGLRRAFPDAHIAWLAWTAYAPLIEGDGDLNEVISIDRRAMRGFWRRPAAWRALRTLRRQLRQGRFDWAIDLQGLFRSGWFAWSSRAALRAGFADAREGARWFYNRPVAVSARHTVDRNIELARALGVDCRPEDMNLRVPPAGAAFAEESCRRHGLRRGEFLVCVPFTRWRTKNYPLRHWRSVAESLRGRTKLVLLGMAEDRAGAEAIAAGMEGVVNLAGQTDIPQMVGLIAASAGVLCGDSAAKFIAPAVGVPAVVVVGPTRVERTGPYLRGQAVVADVPCQGCLKRSCRHVTCMESIEPLRVVEAAEEMLR